MLRAQPATTRPDTQLSLSISIFPSSGCRLSRGTRTEARATPLSVSLPMGSTRAGVLSGPEHRIAIEDWITTLWAGRLSAERSGMDPMSSEVGFGIEQTSDGPYTSAGTDWYTIVELSELVVTVEEEEAFIGWLRLRSDGMVEQLWPGIEAVAQALAERSELTGDEVRAILCPPGLRRFAGYLAKMEARAREESRNVPPSPEAT